MVTLKMIAEKAGVSVAAASAALSGRHGSIGIAEKTRERILRVAEEEGFRPNPMASALRTGRMGAITICMDEPESYLSHPHGAHNFWTICEVAGRHGYRISLLIRDLEGLDHRVMDGCLVLNTQLEPKFEKEIKRLARDVPVVSLYQKIEGAVQVKENTSWREQRKLAADYLYDLGHRNISIAHLGRVSQTSIPKLFEDVARARGIDVNLQAVQQNGLDRRYLSIDTILAREPLPTAVFCIDDDYARALISRIQQRGLSVPDQISVFSGATISGPSAMWPALTGLRIHFEREWEGLFNGFVKIIEKKSNEAFIELEALEIELLERESCGVPSL